MLITFSFEKKTFHNWRTDGPLDQFLRSVLPSAVIDAAKGKPFGGLQDLIGFLENAYVHESAAHTKR